MHHLFILLSLLATVTGTHAALPAEQTVRDVASFPIRDFSGRRTFVLSGLVTAEDGDTFILEDATGALRVSNESNPRTNPMPGTAVRIFGQGYSSTRLLSQHYAQRIEVLGKRPLPTPVEIPSAQVRDPSLLYRRIRLTGVVSSIQHDSLDPQFRWMQMKTESGDVAVALRENNYPPSCFDNLTDAEISIIGHMTPSIGWRTALGPHLLVMTTNALSVIKAPPERPFDAPMLFSQTYPHRQKVSSVIIAANAQRAYLRDADQRLICILPAEGQPVPRAGDLVTAVGFVEPDAFCICLADALWRCERHGASPKTRPAKITNPADMYLGSDADERLDKHYNGAVVRLLGTVRESVSHLQPTGTFLLDCENHTYSVDATALGDAADTVMPDAVMDVTGLCLAEVETPASRLIFPRTRGFTIIPRSASDLVIVRRPPFWTSGKLIAVILILLAATFGFAIWNYQLKTHSERRGRELARERLAHARAEEKVKERTRLAVELHDSISQTLTGVALHLDSAASVCQGLQPKTTAFLTTARDMLAACRYELQGCLWDLRSRTFEEKDMTEAVQRAIGPYVGETPTIVRFNVPRSVLSETVTHTILLIVRELAVNAIRHGQAKNLRIAGELQTGVIRFSVRNDGCPFEPSSVQGPQTGHFGLQGIRERLKDFNGTLHFEKLPGKGMKATVTMAIRNE